MDFPFASIHSARHSTCCLVSRKLISLSHIIYPITRPSPNTTNTQPQTNIPTQRPPPPPLPRQKPQTHPLNRDLPHHDSKLEHQRHGIRRPHLPHLHIHRAARVPLPRERQAAETSRVPPGRTGRHEHLHGHGALFVPGVDSDHDGVGLSCAWVRAAYECYDDGGV